MNNGTIHIFTNLLHCNSPHHKDTKNWINDDIMLNHKPSIGLLHHLYNVNKMDHSYDIHFHLHHNIYLYKHIGYLIMSDIEY